RGARVRHLVATIAALVCLCGCSGGTHGPSGRSSDPHDPPNATPLQNVRTGNREAARIGRAVRLGRAGEAEGLTIRALRPHISQTRLRPRTADPVNGYYVTFPLEFVDVGSQNLTVTPSEFRVEPGNLSVMSGVGPESGAESQLVSTVLSTGQSFRADLTLDVPRRHGELIFNGGRGFRASWRF
ncbi:MAG TPA: hypothetical protein VHV31_05550, partial [Nitrolancea sp.]|nr:hypothetical protein [Nitrolancea sp.]